MEIKYKVDKPENFAYEDKKRILQLLIKQGKVSDPTLEKLESCPFLCTASYDGSIIGIGALKQVYLSPFDYAKVPDIKVKFKTELGYIYVDNEQMNRSFRGLGIGKAITKLLLDSIKGQNIFATTELKSNNPMFFILRKFGFESVGVPYIGHKTHDVISLLVLINE